MNDIFKVRTLGVCKKVQLDEKTAFSFYELKAGDEFRNRNISLNFILFVLEGVIEINANQYENRLIQAEEMILLVRTSAVYVKVKEKTTLYVMYFENFLSSCDQQLFNAYLPDTKKIIYDFSPVAIPQPIPQFLKQIRYVQEQKVNCVHYNGLKHREFFILLRNFCPREDLVRFISPLISRSLHFHNKVLEKYPLLGDGKVPELASLVGMGRKNFDKHFKKEFGTSPAHWILEEKAKRLFIFLKEPDVTIADAMNRFHFNSSTHFNRFCLKHFNKTPGKIIREASKKQKKEKVKTLLKNK